MRSKPHLNKLSVRRVVKETIKGLDFAPTVIMQGNLNDAERIGEVK